MESGKYIIDDWPGSDKKRTTIVDNYFPVLESIHHSEEGNKWTFLDDIKQKFKDKFNPTLSNDISVSNNHNYFFSWLILIDPKLDSEGR